MAFKRCKECGLPLLLGRWLRWENNGTIVQRISPAFRVMLMDADFLEDIFRRIERALGVSVRHIVFEAQRSAAKAYIGNWLNGPLGYVLLFPGTKRFAVQQFNKLAMLLGMVHSETVEYKPRRYGIARMRNPYSLDLMAANVVGAFEILEGRPFVYSWKQQGLNEWQLRVDRAETIPDIAERMYLVFPPAYPGSLQYERCNRCRVPRKLAYLEWHEEDGIIIDSRRNRRMIIMIEDVAGTVFREFRKELGEEVVPLILDAQKEYWLEHIEELRLLEHAGAEPEQAYRMLLETLPLFGQGNPVSLVRTGGSLEIAVENPFSELLLAGTLAAFYQAVEGREPAVNIRMVEEGILRFQLIDKRS